ncbi:MAG: type IV pilus secretin PilQ [Nitrospirae bacterium]|nr:type IV pilus secretin PilQ [Nitrospirota bacterium]
MRKYTLLKPLITIFVLIALLGCANTQAVKQSSQTIEVPALTSLRVDENSLTIQSSKPFTYTLNKTNDPYRATIEIPDMSIGAFTDKIVSDNGMVTEVVPQQIDSPTRMTRLDIVLQSPSSLSPEYKDNTLILSIKKDDPMVFTEAKSIEADPKPLVRLVAVEVPAEKEASPAASRATEINSITIKKSADTVKVIISGNGTMIPNVFPVNERIVVDIPDTALRAALPSQTMSPLKGIRAGKHKDKLRIVLDLKEKTNFDVTAIGNSIEISLMNKEDAQPQRASTNAAKESAAGAAPVASEPAVVAKESAVSATTTDGAYSGKKISLDFQDADIIPIFRLLGDVSGYNIVVNPEVKGKITLKLINVPWDQALDIIMRTFHLSKIVDGNIIRVLPTTAVAKELDEIKNNKKAQSEAGDLVTKIFTVNYANVDKIKEAIDKAKVLSSRGSLSTDKDSSNIIVNDLELNLQKVEALLKDIDTEDLQARQVLIEARIVEVNTDYLHDLGVQWGAFASKATGNGTYGVGNQGLAGTAAPGNFLVNVPASSIAGQLGFGFINRAGTMALDVRLSAMEENKKGKILSNPRLLTMNNIEASIKQGRELQLPSTDKDGQPKLQTVPVDLTLKVTPKITPAGAIILDLSIVKKELLQLINAGGNVGADTTNTDIKTKVLVNNGETLVVGGVYKYSESHSDQGIPGLSKVPLLGQLFKNDNNSKNQFEIIVFVTPRVIESNVSLK